MTTAVKLKANKVAAKAGTLPAIDPRGDEAVSHDIVILSDPQGPRAEAIRALRTHIIAQHIHGGRRALAVCAASIDVGCTFVAANLAVSLAQVGIKTLIIDADLRNPALQRYLRAPSSGPGLQHYLASLDQPLGEAIHPEVLPNLSVLHAGGAAYNPQELLAGERFQTLMDICLRDYDVTIVDTPPANSCADARRISNVVGYSLVVARRNVSLIGDVKTLIGELEADHAVVIGTVLNEA